MKSSLSRIAAAFFTGLSLSLLSVFSSLSPGTARSEPEEKAPRFVLEWGTKGTGPGEFHSPVCIAITRNDEIFVADLNNARIQQFTPEGTWVGGFDLPLDTPPRKSCMVGGLAINEQGLLHVAFMIQHKIGVYTPQGKLVRDWGKKGTGEGELHQPGGIVFPKDGSVAVADQCNHRVQVFSAEGKFLRKWGSHGTNPGQFGGKEPAGSRFAGPHFLTLDSKGRFYTTEGVAGRIQQLSPEGKPLIAWGDKAKEPGAFGEYTFGSLKNTFGPIGVMADRQDRIWVSSLNDRVQCFTPEGKFLYRVDGPTEEDLFAKPHGMAVDSKGFLYIADAGNQRIVKFALPIR